MGNGYRDGWNTFGVLVAVLFASATAYAMVVQPGGSDRTASSTFMTVGQQQDTCSREGFGGLWGSVDCTQADERNGARMLRVRKVESTSFGWD